MNPTRLARLRQHIDTFRLQFAQDGTNTLSAALTPQAMEHIVRAAYPAGWRERVFGPLTTLKLFVGQALSSDGACMDAVGRRLSESVSLGKATCSLNTGPYRKARARLPLAIPRGMLEELGGRLESLTPSPWRWRTRSVKLFDATTVSMPDTRSNQQAYPQNHEQQPGLGFPLARIGALMGLASGAVLGYEVAACQGKDTGEQTLFRTLYRHIQPGAIVLADALHCTWWAIAMLHASGADIVMPQHARRAADFRRGTRLGKRDHLVEWPRPKKPAWMDVETYAKLPEQLRVREVETGGRLLVTTLLDAESVCPRAVSALHAARWSIEVDFRTLKAMMAMDVLRCKSQAMVDKVIAVYLLAYNLIRWAMAKAASLSDTLPRALSFMVAKRALGALEEHLRHHGIRRAGLTIELILMTIAAHKLPHRPNRVEPRAKKRRPKPLPLLTLPRVLARQRILEQRALKVVP
jgi:hypothetical protein